MDWLQILLYVVMTLVAVSAAAAVWELVRKK